jgi:hypothetical protein
MRRAWPFGWHGRQSGEVRAVSKVTAFVASSCGTVVTLTLVYDGQDLSWPFPRNWKLVGSQPRAAALSLECYKWVI